MTYKELADGIILRQYAESKLRGKKFVRLPFQALYYWISQAEAEIQRRLWVITIPYDITTANGTQEYTLPKDFGGFISVVGNSELEYISLNGFQNLTASSGTPNKYTNFYDGTDNKVKFYPTPSDSSVIKTYYWKSIQTFKDAGLTALQNGTWESALPQWGQYAAYTVILPPEYYSLIEDRVLGFIFLEYLQVFEKRLRDLKGFRNSTPENIKGGLGI